MQREILSRFGLVQTSSTVYENAPRPGQSRKTIHLLTLDSGKLPSLSNKPNEAMSSISPAKNVQQEHCPLLSLPAELRNMIYEYAFRVDHIQAIQYDKPVSGKTNNKYETPSSIYTMSLETRNLTNWRSMPQQLAILLALTATCHQIRKECKLMPFEGVLFDVGLHAIQHFLAVVPSEILDNIKVISLWKVPGQMMTSVGDRPFLQSSNENHIKLWMTLLSLLCGLPALETVTLRVRGGVNGLRLFAALAMEPLEIQLKAFFEAVLARAMLKTAVVHIV
jgi:hypothetical protein